MAETHWPVEPKHSLCAPNLDGSVLQFPCWKSNWIYLAIFH